MVLRYTGARIGEVLSIDDRTNIDFRNTEIKLITLKQKRKMDRRRLPTRIIPVPVNLIAEISNYIASYLQPRGKTFKLAQSNFRRKFHEMAAIAEIKRA